MKAKFAILALFLGILTGCSADDTGLVESEVRSGLPFGYRAFVVSEGGQDFICVASAAGIDCERVLP